ncbi:hypothetical protein BD408DRAFT_411032, partial [Parasitella parasitica]
MIPYLHDKLTTFNVCIAAVVIDIAATWAFDATAFDVAILVVTSELMIRWYFS